MTNLPEKKPDLYEAFKAGEVSVQLSTFGHIPVDPTIEVTINKDTQTPDGTTKYSLKFGAIKTQIDKFRMATIWNFIMLSYNRHV